ncbi:MAG TPA: DNA cytosine methyltransferase [Halomicronema sp.]
MDIKPALNVNKKVGYIDFLSEEIKLPCLTAKKPLVIDLFAGCGGMALGFEAAGFKTIGYEILEDAVATYQHNLQGNCYQVLLTQNTTLVKEADVIIAGPPCQPFSVNGHQKGLQDRRYKAGIIEKIFTKFALFLLQRLNSFMWEIQLINGLILRRNICKNWVFL